MSHRQLTRSQQKALFAKFKHQKLIGPLTEQQLNRPNHGGIRNKTIELLEMRSAYLDKIRKPKYERCVKALKERPGINPYAVCHASVNRRRR